MCERLMPPDPDVVIAEIEENFGITISDHDAEAIRTMGELYDYIHAQVSRGQAQVCVTSATFYYLRRALGEVCGVPRERIRPQAKLEELVQIRDRRKAWGELQVRFGNTRLPALRRPLSLARIITAVSFVPFLLVVASSIAVAPTLLIFGCLAGIAAMLLVHRIVCRFTEQYAVEFSPSCTTIRDLVYMLASRHPAPIVSETRRATDKEIWQTLCAIVGDEFDRPPESFSRTSAIC